MRYMDEGKEVYEEQSAHLPGQQQPSGHLFIGVVDCPFLKYRS